MPKLKFRWLFASFGVVILAACNQSNSSAPAATVSATVCGEPLPAVTPVTITNTGRTLKPLGRLTTVGNFPTGGRLTPDGHYYWSLSAGHGQNDIQIVDVGSGSVVQVLPMPGTYGAMTFSPDGLTAYVSGEPIGNSTPAGPTLGNAGDVIHVFSIDTASGKAVEGTPIQLPPTSGGAARGQPPNPALPSFPVGIAVTPNGKTLAVALYNADQAALIDIASGQTTLLRVGQYPYAAAIDAAGQYAYISNAYDGTLSKIDIGKAQVIDVIKGLGGPDGDQNSHPQYILVDPKKPLLYVAVTNHDGVAVVDTRHDTVTHFINLKRSEGYGSEPVSLALAPDEATLYVANAGEDSIASIALQARPNGGPPAYGVIGKIPTADYPSDVALTGNGCTMIWASARGLGSPPNPDYCCGPNQSPTSPQSGAYPSYTLDLLIGQVGVLPTPTDATFKGQTAVVDTSIAVAGTAAPPADTPLVGANGGASDKIKYVFYIVRENRTYDQIFGSDTAGDGDPALELLDDNGVPGPTGGITPNAHALSRMFVLLDHFFEDSEVSVDGHVITTSGYSSNYTTKTIHGDYSNRGRPDDDEGVYGVTFAPEDFLFDQAVRQSITFRNYGELAGGSTPVVSDDGRDTYAAVRANSDVTTYASNAFIGCEPANANGTPDTPLCAFDSGLGAAAPKAQSRIDQFNSQFQAQLASNTVPHFNYLLMPNDHTNGTTPGGRDPLSMVADNDLGIGQFVQIISASRIWPQTAIFIVEDDSQDGADHVDAHRAPAFVISPYVKHGSVVSSHYDQYSVVRTVELILGMTPLSVNDANATPMYDAFTTTPDLTPYKAIIPEQNLLAVNTATTPDARLSAALPWNKQDRVPQGISDQILWHRVFGAKSNPPAPGPHASPEEYQRAVDVMAAYRRGRNLNALLAKTADRD